MIPQNDLSRIKKKINEIEEKSANGDFIYRGEPRHHKEDPYNEKVSSNLWRKYGIEADHFNMEVVQKNMLAEAKKYIHERESTEVVQTETIGETKKYIDETNDNRGDFEILTQLQHYGGKTNLIDFATDYLRALFFACDGSHDENGRIILLQRTEEINNKYRIQKPQHPQNRVISQHSIFVRPLKGYVEPQDYCIIDIPKFLKQPILNHLRKYHGISTETIYNDLHGFITNQTIHQDYYTEFYKGFMYRDRKEYNKAIKHYTEALKLNSGLVEAHNNRGIAYSEINKIDQAIKDYNTAIKLKHDYANAYKNRGAAYGNKGEIDRAIEDYNMAIKHKPDLAEARYNRVMAFLHLQEWEKAKSDLTDVRDMGMDIIVLFRNSYSSVADFEQKHKIKLPEDIASMLTPT